MMTFRIMQLCVAKGLHFAYFKERIIGAAKRVHFANFEEWILQKRLIFSIQLADSKYVKCSNLFFFFFEITYLRK